MLQLFLIWGSAGIVTRLSVTYAVCNGQTSQFKQLSDMLMADESALGGMRDNRNIARAIHAFDASHAMLGASQALPTGHPKRSIGCFCRKCIGCRVMLELPARIRFYDPFAVGINLVFHKAGAS